MKYAMEENIQFESKGLICSGRFFCPDDSDKELPVIVMAHGFSAVKEMYLQEYARYFVDSDFACLIFDYRYLGESEGKPRGQIFPYQQIDDYQRAIAYALNREEVDESRVGIWGTSYSGGHVLKLGACDPRVKAVVSQVPYISGLGTIKAVLGDLFKSIMKGFIETVVKGDLEYIPVVAEKGMAALPGEEAYWWFTETAEKMAPNWENKVTIESLEKLIRYNPGSFAEHISIPILFIVGEKDELSPPRLALKAFEKTSEPKDLVQLPMSHFEAYTTHFEETAEAARNWFSDVLK